MGEDEGGSDADNVAGNVVETGGSRALEAVSRDSVTNLLDGVVGDLELVAVCVDQGTTLVLRPSASTEPIEDNELVEGELRGESAGLTTCEGADELAADCAVTER